MVLTATSAGGNTRPTWTRASAQKRPPKLGSVSRLWRVSGCAMHQWGWITVDPFYSTSRWHSSLVSPEEILERDGPNELEKPPKPTLLLLFLMQCLGRPGTALDTLLSIHLSPDRSTADLPVTFRPYSDLFLSQSRKMSESQAIRRTRSSSNLRSDASWRLPTWPQYTSVDFSGAEADELHHHPADGLCSGLCVGKCNWTKGRRSALLHHRRGRSGKMYSKRTCLLPTTEVVAKSQKSWN